MGSSYVEVCVKIRSLRFFILGCLALTTPFSVYSQQTDDVAKWFDNYLEVREFKTTNARDPFMTSEDKNEAKLGTWLNEQKLKANKGRLSEQEKIMLNKISGLSWDPIDDYWMDMQKAYNKFRKENGKYPSSTSDIPLEAKIGLWLSDQVFSYSNKQLCDEKIYLLESVQSHDWDMYKRQTEESYWDYTLVVYKKFMEDNRREPSTRADNKEEMALAKWLIKQRNAYKNNILSGRRTKLMESVPGHFWGVVKVERKPIIDDEIDDESKNVDTEEDGTIEDETVGNGTELTEAYITDVDDLNAERNVTVDPEDVENILEQKTKNVNVDNVDTRNNFLLYTGEPETSTSEELVNAAVKKIAAEFLGSRSRGVLSKITTSFLTKKGVWPFFASASKEQGMIVFSFLLEEAMTLGSLKTDGSMYLGRVPQYDELKEVFTIYKKGFLK
jgi:hypothetical protein